VKLTCKDKDFLERLKKLLNEKELAIELKEDGIKRLVLRQNYGDKVEKTLYEPAGGQMEILSAI
jgi:porphobilinogen deaminase